MAAMSTAISVTIGRLPAGLATIPAADIALLGGARIAEIDCGDGAATIAVALAYPEALVDGFESDHRALDTARARARTAHVSGRVAFRHVDAGDVRPGDLPTYDVVIAPTHRRAIAERLVGDRGVVVLRDDRTEVRAA